MLILSNEDIEKILPVGACLDVLEEAYRDLGNGMSKHDLEQAADQLKKLAEDAMRVFC